MFSPASPPRGYLALVCRPTSDPGTVPAFPANKCVISEASNRNLACCRLPRAYAHDHAGGDVCRRDGANSRERLTQATQRPKPASRAELSGRSTEAAESIGPFVGTTARTATSARPRLGLLRQRSLSGFSCSSHLRITVLWQGADDTALHSPGNRAGTSRPADRRSPTLSDGNDSVGKALTAAASVPSSCAGTVTLSVS